MQLNPVPLSQISLGEGLLRPRQAANRRYLLQLTNDNLLRAYRQEAGLWSDSRPGQPVGIHGGWEAPASQLRGHFLGHWLSAAAALALQGDRELRAKAEALVDGLVECQAENGGEWAGSIPPTYLEWTKRGKSVWAPHYTVHKTLMGLMDFYRATAYPPALEVTVRWARWFGRWTEPLTTTQMDDVLDYETGGMLEVWADLYSFTRDPAHLRLLDRYTRRRLFDPLLAGEDVLTNLHANTTIPEILGAARAYEVTGEPRWLALVQAYWDQAVTRRGWYATGGQTSGEIWSPPGELAARLGDKTQEHCAVFHMMRLAEFLLRWTGRAGYADYWERNLYNGVLAQGHWELQTVPQSYNPPNPATGLISYFLPLRPGSRKGWASETEHFFCCHGTLVQAHATHTGGIFYAEGTGLTVAQFIPSSARVDLGGQSCTVTQKLLSHSGTIQAIPPAGAFPAHAPASWTVQLTMRVSGEAAFWLRFRLPAWLAAPASVRVNGRPAEFQTSEGWGLVERTWADGDVVELTLPKAVTWEPLADEPDRGAFLEGPVVLAALVDEDRRLELPPGAAPPSLLTPDNEREWGRWTGQYRTKNQQRGLRFVPLYEVGYEAYSVYLPIKSGVES